MSITPTLEEIDKTIKRVRTLRNILTVEAYFPIKSFAIDQKKIIRTEDIKNIIQKKYEVLEVLQEDKICNWNKPSIGQNGTWKFKIKKKRVSKPKTIPVQKKEELKPVEKEIPKVIEKPTTPPEPPPQKKNKKTSSNSSSFRGRIKKIANKK